MIIIDDLKKTVYLKTAIIEKEWMIRLKKDIFVGPKYLENGTIEILGALEFMK